MSEQTIVLGGGCFWCTEAVFEQVQGVTAVESGYCNGHFPNPSYEQVCTGETGHAEVVRVSFDDQHISLRDILAIFFATHDPTTLNRQGHDLGTQYRSGIYVSSEPQAAVAREVLQEAQQAFGGRVVTEVQPLQDYSRAEDYHQRYFARHPHQGYCAAVIAPKVEKFRKVFSSRLRKG
jgi:peptide-methionine (S)-S-oxide reductase